ncbi:MAG: HlyD family secretion protein [Methylococcales bacterium]
MAFKHQIRQSAHEMEPGVHAIIIKWRFLLIGKRLEMSALHYPGRLISIALASFLFCVACDEERKPFFQGYVEGDYVYLAAPGAGYLNSLNVGRGTYVAAGTIAFSIDDDLEQFELDEAEAQMISAQEKVANLKEPRREPEIAALEAQLKTRQANLQFAQAQLKRMEDLVKKGFISKAGLDEARSVHDDNAAQVEAARELLAAYRITLGRQPEIRGAEADLKAAGAKMEQKRWQVDKKSVVAPSPGQITEIYYRPGEWVPAGQPVLSFLPDDRRRIRFFAAESDVAGIRLGQQVEADCDGCESPIRAKVTFISAQAEYTPPVIYSRETRAKLVFRVEAVPAPGDALKLHPGLPMDVRLVNGA